MIVAATGHRPDKLGGHDIKTRRAMGALAVEYLHERRPTKVIVGMALGWDQAVAGACVALGVPFTAAVPWSGQPDLWPEESQRRYWRLLGQAAEVVTVCEGAAVNVPRAMQRRNEWMVDNAEGVVALWNGLIGGGTANCIAYAQKVGRPIENLWERWIFDEDTRAMLG